MNRISFIFLIFFSTPVFGQMDSGNSSVSISFDTTWNHSITEADLILKLSVTTRLYISGKATFNCDVFKDIKGKFNASTLSWTMSIKDVSLERTHKRFDAINPPMSSKQYSAYVGFYKTLNETSDIKDPVTGEKYNFFMSSNSLK